MQVAIGQQLTQRQALVITPQLQQAIKLLQMSNHELSEYADELARDNLFLKVAKANISTAPTQARLPSVKQTSSYDAQAHLDNMARGAEAISIYEYVERQISLHFKEDQEHMLALGIVPFLHPTGWLSENQQTIADHLGVSVSDLDPVLQKLRQFEPVGIFAFDLADCLKMQAIEHQLLSPCMEYLLNNLDLVARGDLDHLSRHGRYAEREIAKTIQSLRALDPKPGLKFHGEGFQPISEPDLIARKENDVWKVELNHSTLPSITIDKAYQQELEAHIKDEKGREFMREAMASAHWFRRAVMQRNTTTLQVGAAIVSYQQEFLDKGIQYLRPLQLRHIAERASVHESTVSRITSAVMMATPRGTFPLKAFFSSSLQRDNCDEGASARAIRQKISEIIAQEPPQKPLSDDAISKLFEAEGVTLARRTVAKYREMENIPSSAKRRRQAKLKAALAQSS